MARTINWFVNNACNLDAKCLFCHREKSAPESDTATALNLVDKIAENRMRRVTIGGGEPLLRADLEEILRALKRHNITISLHTNATLLLPRLAGLAGYVDILSLPIESTDDAINVGMRGVPYARLLDKVLPEAQRLGFTVAYKTVATKENIETIPQIYRWLRVRGDFAYWKVYQFRPLNDAAKHLDRFAIDDANFADLAKKLRSKKDTRVQPISREAGHQSYVFLENDGTVLTYDPAAERNVPAGNLNQTPLRAIAHNITQYHRFAHRLASQNPPAEAPVGELLNSLLPVATGPIKIRVIRERFPGDPRLDYFSDH